MRKEASEEKIIKEKDDRLQYKISLIILALAIIFIGAFATYAFFQTPGGDNQNQSVSVQAGNMELIFSDGNPGFSKELEFGGSAEKTFTIENTGSLDTVAKINWKNLVNNYLEGSLTYFLSYIDEEGNTTEVITNKNVPRSETSSTIELVNGISIPSEKTYTLTLTIKLNDLPTDQTADLNARFSSEFSIEEGTNEPAGENLVQALLAKTNDVSITDYNSGVKGEMFTFSHDATAQTEALTDYRYIGNEPNNYINFNNETWRIIGVFTVEGENGEKEQRIKIIRNESIGEIEWDLNEENEWPTSSLATLLNTGDYYNRSGSYSSNGLTDTAKSQIVSTKWYLGGNNASSVDGPTYYNFERGTKVYSGRSTNVIAKVGIMYPSDYIYTYANGVDNTCYTDGYNCETGTPSAGWLFNSSIVQWTIAPNSSDSNDAFFVISNGYVYNDRTSVICSFGVRPSVYLRSDIEIISGTGAENDSYILKA